MARDEGDAVGDVIEPARGIEYAKWLLLGFAVCGGLPLFLLALFPDKSDENVAAFATIVAIGMSTVAIASTWGYVRHGTHRLVVGADDIVYIRGAKSERHRRTGISGVRVEKYLKSRVISVCTADKRLLMVDYGWWGRPAAERLAELLEVPLAG